jgi:hypothetical protein
VSIAKLLKEPLQALEKSIRRVMSLRPSRGFQQFIIRRSQHVEVVGMIATALIDSRIQLEMDLIEPVDEANPKFLSVDFPDQALRNSFRQPEPEQASITAAGSVV